jgi:hypothetical protein
MQTTLERLVREAAKVGLKINISKSKEMRIAMKNNNETLYIQGGTIERVTQFVYLGSIIDDAGGTEADIATRIRKPRQHSAYSVKSGNRRNIQCKPNFVSSTQMYSSFGT